MSDTKPKRAAREQVQSEAATAETPTAATAPVIESHAAPDPEPVSAAALAQALPQAAADPLPASAAISAEREPAQAVAEGAWAALAEAQAALARGFERAAVEMTGISRSGIAATADATVALLGAKTFAEAVAINAGLARRGVDTMLEGTARLSEIGVEAVADASRPILARFGGGWSGFAAG